MNTFYQFCVGACIFVLFVTGSISFVNALGVFPTTVAVNSTQSLNMTSSVWDIVFSSPLGLTAITGVGGAIALAILTQSLSIIGIWLFSNIFWGCWIQTISIIYVGGFMVGALGLFMGLITLGMAFIFVAAVIGMLSGSG